MAAIAGIEPEKAQNAHDARRSQVLEAARACFARSGFRGASMQEICAEARMSPGALYRYFPSKEAIIEAIAEDERCDAAAIVETMHGTAPLIDRVSSCALGYFAYMREAGASSLMAEIGAESLRNTAIGQRFARIDNHVRDTVRDIFSEAVERGEIPPIDDMNATIGMTMAAVDGIALRQISDPDLTPARIEPVLRRMLAGVLQIKS